MTESRSGSLLRVWLKCTTPDVVASLYARTFADGGGRAIVRV
jgi:hypothetical protein